MKVLQIEDVHRVLVALVAELGGRYGADPAMLRTGLAATLVHMCYASGDPMLARSDVDLALQVIGEARAQRDGLAPPKGEPS